METVLTGVAVWATFIMALVLSWFTLTRQWPYVDKGKVAVVTIGLVALWAVALGTEPLLMALR